MQPNTTKSSSLSPQIVEVQDVIDKLDLQLQDIEKYYTHTSSNSLDQYYRQMIDTIVLDLTVIPVNQEILGLEPTDDAGSVNAGLAEMSGKLAKFFNKAPHSVELDVFNRMNTFPIDDTREARRLRHTNRLN